MNARPFALVLFTACAAPSAERPTHHARPTAPVADTAAPDTGGGDTGGGNSGGGDSGGGDSGGAGWRCPAGTALVPAATPYCAFHYEASRTPEGPASQAGVAPWVGITFLDARAACAGWSPVAEDGRAFGPAHLITRDEWLDAGDGVPGPGGPPYPWGTEVAGDRCWLPDENGNHRVADTQLTGSAPDCVSAFGVYDQLGNAWEWVDPQLNADPDAWSAAAAAVAPTSNWSVDDAGRIRWSGPTPTLAYAGVVLHGLRVTPDTDGVLLVDADGRWSGALPYSEGFLQIVDNDGAPLPARYLPVMLVARSDTVHEVHFAAARATEPFTAKVGGAWYAGSARTSLTEVTHEHPAGFNGTIGFRCAVAALPE